MAEVPICHLKPGPRVCDVEHFTLRVHYLFEWTTAPIKDCFVLVDYIIFDYPVRDMVKLPRNHRLQSWMAYRLKVESTPNVFQQSRELKKCQPQKLNNKIKQWQRYIFLTVTINI